ncbi:hypothetical protein V8C34DRAFT_287286 [Trichoderma compactum]
MQMRTTNPRGDKTSRALHTRLSSFNAKSAAGKQDKPPKTPRNTAQNHPLASHDPPPASPWRQPREQSPNLEQRVAAIHLAAGCWCWCSCGSSLKLHCRDWHPTQGHVTPFSEANYRCSVLSLVRCHAPSHSMAYPSFVDLVQGHTATGRGQPKPTGNVSRCGLIHGMACCPLTAEMGTTDISCLSLSTTPLRTTESRANRVCSGLSYRPAWT